MPITLDDLLRDLCSREGSDLHLRVGEPPVFRVHGKLIRTDYPVVERVEDFLYPILSEERRKRFEQFMELDLSYEIKGVSRFRVNCFRQRGKMGAVLRSIPVKIKTIDE
ncbi:MAG: type IV pili twitching motility protein PilT, partial [Armatimonadota bacterium]